MGSPGITGEQINMAVRNETAVRRAARGVRAKVKQISWEEGCRLEAQIGS
jgi:hypothetical protein